MSGWTDQDLVNWANSFRPGTFTPKPSIDQPKRGMNKWETEYAAELENQKRAGLITDWKFEAIKLRLADTAYYKPDFLVISVTGQPEYHEVKGHWREAALVRFKVAADLYPWWLFFAVRKRKVSEGGGWAIVKSLNGRR